MKKSKNVFAVGGILLGIGIIIMLLGLIFGGSTEDIPMGGRVTFSQEYRDVSGIDVSLPVCNVDIIEGDTFKVEMKNLPSSFFEVSYSSKEIKIEKKSPKWSKYLSIRGVPKIEITCPKSYALSNIKIENGIGKINISSIYCKKLSADIGMGMVSVQNVVTLGTDLQNGIGAVLLSGKSAGENKIDCGIGYVYAIGIGDPQTYGVEMDNALGAITFNEDNYGGFGNNIKLSGSGSDSFDISCAFGKAVLQLYAQDDAQALIEQYGGDVDLSNIDPSEYDKYKDLLEQYGY